MEVECREIAANRGLLAEKVISGKSFQITGEIIVCAIDMFLSPVSSSVRGLFTGTKKQCIFNIFVFLSVQLVSVSLRLVVPVELYTCFCPWLNSTYVISLCLHSLMMYRGAKPRSYPAGSDIQKNCCKEPFQVVSTLWIGSVSIYLFIQFAPQFFCSTG